MSVRLSLLADNPRTSCDTAETLPEAPSSKLPVSSTRPLELASAPVALSIEAAEAVSMEASFCLPEWTSLALSCDRDDFLGIRRLALAKAIFFVKAVLRLDRVCLAEEEALEPDVDPDAEAEGVETYAEEVGRDEETPLSVWNLNTVIPSMLF